MAAITQRAPALARDRRGASPGAEAIGAILTQLHTPDLRALIEVGIAIIDARAGDFDLEDDDPSGDVLDAGEAPSDDARAIAATAPRYGTDQRRGPRNYCRHDGVALAA